MLILCYLPNIVTKIPYDQSTNSFTNADFNKVFKNCIKDNKIKEAENLYSSFSYMRRDNNNVFCKDAWELNMLK